MTYRSNESKVLAAAITIGFQAQFSPLDPDSPAQLLFMATQMLDPEHPVLAFVKAEVEKFEVARRDPDKLAEWGKGLRDGALTIGRPAPVDAGRRDLHG